MRLAILLLACTGIMPAQEIALQVEPAQSKVEFTLGATLHTVHGTFLVKRGEIRFDPATGRASGEVVVDAASARTGNSDRDQKMHREILESARYPEIVFHFDRVEGTIAATGASKAQLYGSMSIHGSTHQVVIPAEIESANGLYTATAQLVVPYIAWGMKNPSTFVLRVRDKVELTIHTVATARPATLPTAR